VAALSRVTLCALVAWTADAAPAHPVLTRRIATTTPTRAFADLIGDANPYDIHSPLCPESRRAQLYLSAQVGATAERFVGIDRTSKNP
jgi:hypothetical protein